MKAVLAVALPAALLVAACVAPTEDAPGAAAPAGAEVGSVPVVRAVSPPEIDGVPEELWTSAVTRRLERSRGHIPQSADIQGEFRAMWDDEALYVLAQVLDDHEVSGEGSAPWDDDGVEVYLDGDGSRNDAVEGYDGNDRQYVFRWDDPAAYEANEGSVEGIRVAHGERDYGYRVEVAIPWSALEVDPPAGGAVGLDVHVNDDDGVGREDKLMWSDSEDQAHSEPRRFGKADWLDPEQVDPDGTWPAGYLASVYGGTVFTECWETFRYLANKGADVHLNVSGRIPAAWAGSDGETLVDFDAYAEMVVGLAQWAREEEGLPFTTLAPFNETNLGFPEGPRIADWGVHPAVKAIVRKLDAAGLGDVKLVLICDSPPVSMERHRPLLHDSDLVGRLAAFSHHTYGDGNTGDAGPGWYLGDSPQAELAQALAMSPHRGVGLWMTEYGDLDQTGLVEWGVARRSTRRPMKFVADGFSAGIAWDAYDNLHEHDGVGALYGLLETDRDTWAHTPKKRYFAAKQVYRFVRPGWTRVAVDGPPPNPEDVYGIWHDPMRQLRLLGFVSPDGEDFTIVGMSRIEADVELEIALAGLASAGGKAIAYHRTTRSEDCELVGQLEVEDGALRVVVPESSIFTLTTRR